MAETKINWADVVWNPITGCTKVSDGCRNCYAERISKRLAGRCGYPKDEPFKVTVHEDKFLEPLTWKIPRRVFVNSMSDLFHPEVLDDWILAAFVAMGLTYEHTGEMKEISPGHEVGIYKPKHTFMILTKRPQRMKDILDRLMSNETDEEWDQKADFLATQLSYRNGDLLPINAIFTFTRWLQDGMPGLWLGVSVENQATADERIPLLLQAPTKVRFISAEPLLGSINLEAYLSVCDQYGEPSGPRCNSDGSSALNWVIAGGESGPGARPMHPDWVRNLRNQCQGTGTKFFFKQWGEWVPTPYIDSNIKASAVTCIRRNGELGDSYRDGVRILHLGKKKAGRELDGRTWDDLPEIGGKK